MDYENGPASRESTAGRCVENGLTKLRTPKHVVGRVVRAVDSGRCPSACPPPVPELPPGAAVNPMLKVRRCVSHSSRGYPVIDGSPAACPPGAQRRGVQVEEPCRCLRGGVAAVLGQRRRAGG